MIKFKKYFNWEKNDTNDMYSIAIYYDSQTKISMPKEYQDQLKKSVRIDTILKLLSFIIAEKNNSFAIRLKDSKFSWQPKFLKNRKIDIDRSRFLRIQSWKGRKFYGHFTTTNIKLFLELFIKFPYEYSYQNIIIINNSRDMLIEITASGSVWIVSEDKKLLEQISLSFEKKGAAIVPSYNMR